MNWSLRIGRLLGIQVFVHWTFFILLVFVFLLGAGVFAGQATIAWMDGLRRAGFIVLLFVFVLLHELGHALTARSLGNAVLEVTLYPFGGIARFETKRYNAVHELLITAAGPAVNLVLMILLGGAAIGFAAADALGGTGTTASAAFERMWNDSLLFQLAMVNAILVIFNMLPIFPMDGGRILRSLVAMMSNEPRATVIAARVSQVGSVAMVAAAVGLGSIMLGAIGVFMFLAATSELRPAQVRRAARAVSAAQAMSPGVPIVSTSDFCAYAAEVMRSAAVPVALVMDGGRILGVLEAARAVSGVSGSTVITAARMGEQGHALTIDAKSTLDRALEQIGMHKADGLVVMNQGQAVGVLSVQAIVQALQKRA